MASAHWTRWRGGAAARRRGDRSPSCLSVIFPKVLRKGRRWLVIALPRCRFAALPRPVCRSHKAFPTTSKHSCTRTANMTLPCRPSTTGGSGSLEPERSHYQLQPHLLHRKSKTILRVGTITLEEMDIQQKVQCRQPEEAALATHAAAIITRTKAVRPTLKPDRVIGPLADLFKPSSQ